jgi:hypothetical protein
MYIYIHMCSHLYIYTDYDIDIYIYVLKISYNHHEETKLWKRTNASKHLWLGTSKHCNKWTSTVGLGVQKVHNCMVSIYLSITIANDCFSGDSDSLLGRDNLVAGGIHSQVLLDTVVSQLVTSSKSYRPVCSVLLAPSTLKLCLEECSEDSFGYTSPHYTWIYIYICI